MSTVGVVAHAKKSFDGGLGALRADLESRGITPVWREFSKSRKAPRAISAVLDDGADLVLVWGGDGTVQRSIDTLAGTDVPIGILPAGTANLLATNLGIPKTIHEAVDVALHGRRRRIDTGTVNGEHFAVLAGAGFDALVIDEADSALKDRLGRAAYVWTGARNLATGTVDATVEVDGERFFTGPLSCVLVGNVGEILGGIEAFEGASPEDGLLEFGVVTAGTPLEWTRALLRTAVSSADKSPFVRTTRGIRMKARFTRKIPYELDGGERGRTRTFSVKTRPGSVVVCVPDPPVA